MTWQTNSGSSEHTEQLGRAIGAKLRGGEVIELVSDLGGGKTTLVRGIAAGAGSIDRVASPSFTLSKVYETPSFTIHHFDFYRLPEPGIMSYELDEVINGRDVVLIEWGGIVASQLPHTKIQIVIRIVGEDERNISVTFPQAYAYVFEGLEL